MEDISSVSSEEELLQLRNEGKISEDEYEELRGAMRKSTKSDFEPPPAATDKPKSKRKLGKIAFYLMLLGIIFAYACFFTFGYHRSTHDSQHVWPWFLLALVLEIAAFAMGVVAWPDAFAKATVVTVSFIIVLSFLFAIAFL